MSYNLTKSYNQGYSVSHVLDDGLYVGQQPHFENCELQEESVSSTVRHPKEKRVLVPTVSCA